MGLRAILAIVAAGLGTATAIVAASSKDPPALAGPPIDGGIYVLGNSLFTTGVDIGALSDAFPDDEVTFGEYSGHYSNMWYAAVRNGLAPSGARPKLVVWGFRPSRALFPAFRSARRTDLDAFLDQGDRDFARVMERSGETFAPGGRFNFNALAPGDESSQEDFVWGDPVPFAGSFPPLIAKTLASAGVCQLVVIFRHNYLPRRIDPEDVEAYRRAAAAYFREHAIPYVDLYTDQDLGAGHYAKGDHFNAAGRALVTDRVISALAASAACAGGASSGQSSRDSMVSIVN